MSEKIEVDADALKKVLQALVGPPHHIRELQALRGLPIGDPSPIDVLVNQYNEWANKP